jgi:RNA polymerase sigma factor (TIGR02999 family)
MPEKANLQFSRYYDELQRIARQLLDNERNGITQQPSDLLHDAFLRLHGPVESDGQFLRNARTQMEWLLLDHVRRERRRKRGEEGAARNVLFDGEATEVQFKPPDREEIERAIKVVEKQNEHAARVARLKIFEGLAVEKIAEALGVISRTVDRDWKFARAVILRELYGRRE